jgi:hypothetical protein
MFSAKEIKNLLDAQPFRAFKIHMSDGSSYEVNNHDAAIVSRNSLDVGVNPDRDGIAEMFMRCAIIHIAKIEETQAA